MDSQTPCLSSSCEQRLRAVEIFRDIPADSTAVATLVRLGSIVTFRAGETVVREGERGDRMFVVLAGEVEVQKQTRDGDTYTVSEVSAQQGGVIGEVALFDDEARTATVVCTTPCEMLVVTRQQFQQFMHSHPREALSVVCAIARTICRRLRKADEDILTLFDALIDHVAESDGLRS